MRFAYFELKVRDLVSLITSEQRVKDELEAIKVRSCCSSLKLITVDHNFHCQTQFEASEQDLSLARARTEAFEQQIMQLQNDLADATVDIA